MRRRRVTRVLPGVVGAEVGVDAAVPQAQWVLRVRLLRPEARRWSVLPLVVLVVRLAVAEAVLSAP